MGRCVPAWLGLAAAAVIIAVAGCGPVSQPPSIEHKIYASGDWQGIGLQVHRGDKVAVRAHGAWLYTPGEYHGPEGHARYLAPSFYPVPGVPGGVLLVRIGETGQARVAGQAGRFVADSFGELAFRINDDFLADNDGFVVVQVSTYKGIGPR